MIWFMHTFVLRCMYPCILRAERWLMSCATIPYITPLRQSLCNAGKPENLIGLPFLVTDSVGATEEHIAMPKFYTDA